MRRLNVTYKPSKHHGVLDETNPPMKPIFLPFRRYPASPFQSHLCAMRLNQPFLPDEI
jgi:hypothetical protein